MIGREGVLPGPPRTGPSPSSGISEGGGLIHAPPGGPAHISCPKATNPNPTTLSTIVNAATQALSAAKAMITESVEYAFYDEDEYQE